MTKNIDIMYFEQNGVLGVAIRPAGRLQSLAQEHAKEPKVWIYADTVVPEITRMLSGRHHEGLTFVKTLRSLGLVVEESAMVIPFSNAGKYNFEIDTMVAAEGSYCRQDGPRKNPNLMNEMAQQLRQLRAVATDHLGVGAAI